MLAVAHFLNYVRDFLTRKMRLFERVGFCLHEISNYSKESGEDAKNSQTEGKRVDEKENVY